LSKRASPKKILSDVIEKIELEIFENLAIDILEYRKSGEVLIDLSLLRSLLGAEDTILQNLSKKYQIEKNDIRDMLDALSYLLKERLVTEQKKLIEKFGQDEKLANKATRLVEIADKLLQKYPDIRERFYLTTFSKTNYIGGIDWEIVIKVVEPPIYGFEKRDRFPVCVLRFLLERSSSLIYPLPPLEERIKEFIFEASLSDINKLIETLSTIKEKMVEVNRELVREGE